MQGVCTGLSRPFKYVEPLVQLSLQSENARQGLPSKWSGSCFYYILFTLSGELIMWLREMAQYLYLMINISDLDGRQLFSTEFIERMERLTTTSEMSVGHDFGYGLGIYALVVAGHRLHGREGITISGFMATSICLPDSKVRYFVATESIG